VGRVPGDRVDGRAAPCSQPSRLGHDAAHRPPRAAPLRAVLDGEPVALGADGKADFTQLCESLLQRRFSTPLTFTAFDVLSVGGESVTQQPYSKRRLILEDLELDARAATGQASTAGSRPRTARIGVGSWSAAFVLAQADSRR
jgi:ATP-dependent DNA ligase